MLLIPRCPPTSAQVRSKKRDKERGVGSHRLPDKRRPPPRDEFLNHCDDVSDERIARQIIGKPRARAVPRWSTSSTR